MAARAAGGREEEDHTQQRSRFSPYIRLYSGISEPSHPDGETETIDMDDPSHRLLALGERFFYDYANIVVSFPCTQLIIIVTPVATQAIVAWLSLVQRILLRRRH